MGLLISALKREEKRRNKRDERFKERVKRADTFQVWYDNHYVRPKEPHKPPEKHTCEECEQKYIMDNRVMNKKLCYECYCRKVIKKHKPATFKTQLILRSEETRRDRENQMRGKRKKALKEQKKRDEKAQNEYKKRMAQEEKERKLKGGSGSGSGCCTIL
jgi:hypothetical protein